MSPVLPLIAGHFAAAGPIEIPGLGIAIDPPLFAQLIATLPSIGLMLGGGPTGLAIDRFGARNVLVAALLAFAVFGSAGLYVENPGLLLASRFALGFAAVGCGSATIWLIGQRFSDRGRARALSYRNLLGGVGGFASTLAAGQAAARFGWHGAFGLYLMALPIVPLALLALPSLPAGRVRERNAPRDSLRHLWPIFVLVAALAVVMMMNTTQLSFLLAENGLSSPAAQARVMSVGSIAVMAGSLVYAQIGPLLGLRWNYSLISAALGLGIATTGLSHGALVAIIGAGLTGFGAGMMVPHFTRLVLDRAPAAARGRAVGLNYSALYLGDLLNPLLVHPLAVAIGIHRAFLLIGATVAATALRIVIPGRAGRPEAEPAVSRR
jgi:MFS family permease